MQDLQDTRLRILLVEDNPGDRDLIFSHLEVEEGVFEIEAVETLGEARQQLVATEKDVVLLDLGLPDSQGIDTLKGLIASGCDLPVIVLTGLNDDTLGIDALRSGAQDYLYKGRLNKELIVRAIRYAVERRQLQLALALEIEKREQERNEATLKGLSSSTTVSAALYGDTPLSESVPELFPTITGKYGDLLRISLETQVKKMARNVSDDLRELADQIGRLGAGPRDVIEIHKAALKRLTETETRARARALAMEGRFLVLEMMGYLVSFYRRNSVVRYVQHNNADKGIGS